MGGKAWGTAAEEVGKALGLDIRVQVVGPDRAYEDLVGDGARRREVSFSGAILVRPDHHVAWRRSTVVAAPKAELAKAMRAILGR